MWNWQFTYPNGYTASELHIPLDVPVRVILNSEDVIHSLFIPAFRIKQDIVPGKTVNTWFEATKAGSYHLFCSQYCGTKHAGMIGEVIAQSPEDYAAWLASEPSSGITTDRGARLFLRYGCSGCHAASSSVAAPPLEGIYGKLIPLEGGKFVQVDDAYLRDSILEPAKQIAAGYKPVMPSFKGIISESDLIELIAYLKSLAPARPAPIPAAVKS